MKKHIIFSLIFILNLTLLQAQTVKERLIGTGAWFLLSQTMEEETEGKVLVMNEYFKKDDISSLLFDGDNHLYSVFSDQGKELNEDLWRLVDDNNLVIVSLNGETSQVMEILHLDSEKLILRYWNKISEEGSSSIISTYLSTKNNWLSNEQVDQLNSIGILEVEDMTP